MKYLSVLIAYTLLFSSCKKNVDEVPDTPTNPEPVKGELSIQFDNRVGNSALHLNIGKYTGITYGEEYTFTSVKYYISNIVLTGTNDSLYTVPQDSCYFLIDQSDNTTWFPKVKVPVGDYKGLSFMIGVDSLRNTKDIAQRTGVLDPAGAANGMYWGWNSGYIFFKAEGTSPASAEPGNTFMYHIGGFGGYSSPTINNLKTIDFDLTTQGIAKVRTDRKSNIHLVADLSQLFDKAGSQVRIGANPVVMFSDFSTVIAYNYSQMFSHDHTEN